MLYLFAIPVLAMAGLNLVLFIGSAWRLHQLVQNAANVGRKKDNKQRLLQCIKITSWMGISWIFGIVPNIMDMDELWYLFAVANALQGVQIFLAFGLSKRARDLMHNTSTEGDGQENLPAST